jgi:hypothetical protein
MTIAEHKALSRRRHKEAVAENDKQARQQIASILGDTIKEVNEIFIDEADPDAPYLKIKGHKDIQLRLNSKPPRFYVGSGWYENFGDALCAAELVTNEQSNDSKWAFYHAFWNRLRGGK